MYPHHPENSSRHAIAHPAAAGAALSDAFLGKIYRATSDEARRLFLALDEADRARLALFCNGKAHLRGHGRAIATVREARPCLPFTIGKQSPTRPT